MSSLSRLGNSLGQQSVGPRHQGHLHRKWSVVRMAATCRRLQGNPSGHAHAAFVIVDADSRECDRLVGRIPKRKNAAMRRRTEPASEWAASMCRQSPWRGASASLVGAISRPSRWRAECVIDAISPDRTHSGLT